MIFIIKIIKREREDTIMIRKANQDDINELIELRLTYINCHFGEISKEQRDRLLIQLPDYYCNHLGQDFIAYFAEEDEKVVSTAFMIINEKPANPNFITGKTGLILNVYTYPEYRRRGLSTKVISELIKEAKSNDLSYIELSATNDGEPLYRKLGFQNRSFDCTEMILRL
jgi:ribosomal protein S18 acetylase RimI-like enzyme